MEANSTIITLTMENFKTAAVESEIPVVIDFWAPWCGPCRSFEPIFNQAAELLGQEAVLAKVNVDEQPEIAGAFGIQSIPTVAILNQGKVVDAWAGVMPAPAIAERVRAKVTS